MCFLFEPQDNVLAFEKLTKLVYRASLVKFEGIFDTDLLKRSLTILEPNWPSKEKQLAYSINFTKQRWESEWKKHVGFSLWLEYRIA